MMRGYLKDNDIRIKDGTDVNAVMRGMKCFVECLFELLTQTFQRGGDAGAGL